MGIITDFSGVMELVIAVVIITLVFLWILVSYYKE